MIYSFISCFSFYFFGTLYLYVYVYLLFLKYINLTKFEEQNNDAGCEELSSRGRSRNGISFAVKYYSCGIYCVCFSRSGKKRKWNKGGTKGDNVFDKMLKRRGSPLRPCSSYSFLVMNWAVAKRSSFVETSKRLSRQWSELPYDVMKVYNNTFVCLHLVMDRIYMNNICISTSFIV